MTSFAGVLYFYKPRSKGSKYFKVSPQLKVYGRIRALQRRPFPTPGVQTPDSCSFAGMQFNRPVFLWGLFCRLFQTFPGLFKTFFRSFQYIFQDFSKLIQNFSRLFLGLFLKLVALDFIDFFLQNIFLQK